MIHGNWLAKWAQVVPNKAAVIDMDADTALTYEQLNGRADRVAQLLSGLGVERGDRVAVLGQNRLEQVELFFGLAKLGAVLVPVNWRMAADEVAYVLSDAQPKALFYGSDMETTVSAIAQKDFSGLRVGFDQQGRDGYRARLETSSQQPASCEGLLDDSPLMLLYTSGTTGRPKGAILTHGTITWNAINTACGWDLGHDDVTLTHTPFFHTGGWNVLTLPLIHRGATVVIAGKFDPNQTVQAIERYGVTVLFAVPTMFQMMWDSPHMAKADFQSVRFFISGGAPCPIPLIEAFSEKGLVFKQGYGLTEVGPNCFVLDERDAIRKAGSVGFPVLHLDTRMVDSEGREVGVDEVGELQLRGPTVCAGYWNNSQASGEAMADGGWFKTGDLFRRDSEGYHYVVGRLKEMYISGGENVYPAEVERVLYQVSGVREAAVIGVPDDRWGEVGHAFVALDPTEDSLPDSDMIMAHCKEQLARYKVPKQLTVLPDLPKGPSGKILKTGLNAGTS